MKVGDLVTLSAYGKKVQRTQWILKGDVGVITQIKAGYIPTYKVKWCKSTMKRHSYYWNHMEWLERKDLKFVKKRKT